MQKSQMTGKINLLFYYAYESQHQTYDSLLTNKTHSFILSIINCIQKSLSEIILMYYVIDRNEILTYDNFLTNSRKIFSIFIVKLKTNSTWFAKTNSIKCDLLSDSEHFNNNNNNNSLHQRPFLCHRQFI